MEGGEGAGTGIGIGIKQAFSNCCVTASFWQIEFAKDVLLFHDAPFELARTGDERRSWRWRKKCKTRRTVTGRSSCFRCIDDAAPVSASACCSLWLRQQLQSQSQSQPLPPAVNLALKLFNYIRFPSRCQAWAWLEQGGRHVLLQSKTPADKSLKVTNCNRVRGLKSLLAPKNFARALAFN